MERNRTMSKQPMYYATGKQPFHENYTSKKTIVPQVTQFPYDEVDGDPIIMDDEDAAIAAGNAKAAEVISKLFNWTTDVQMFQSSRRNLETIGLRFLALAWVFDPALFNNVSATALAKQVGCNRKRTFNALTAEASRVFGISNRGQSHAWNRSQQATGKADAGKASTDKPAEATTRCKGKATPVTTHPHPRRNLLNDVVLGEVQSHSPACAPSDQK
jgi:hypothetical protein